MDFTKHAREFWQNGYLVIENFFSDDLMDDLNEVILNHYGMNPDWEHTDELIQKSATEVVPWFPFREGDTSFEVIENDPRLHDLTEAIPGEGRESLYLMAMFSKKGTKGQAWHQDSPPENHERFNLNRLFYTHDINDETCGKTIVMPGSHRGGAITVGDPHEDLENQVVLSPKKGTLVILHGHAWHRVLPIKGEYRLSTNARYPGDEYVDWCAYSFFSRWDEANMIAFARKHGKPVFIAEATPTISTETVKTNGKTKETILSNPAQAAEAWEKWFTPFFNTIHQNPDVVKAVSYINCNWKSHPMWVNNPTFQDVDARLHTSEAVSKKWLEETSQDMYLKASPGLFDALWRK